MTSGRQSETQYQYKGSITRGKPGKPRRRGGGHAPLILLLVLMLVATGGVGILALHY